MKPFNLPLPANDESRAAVVENLRRLLPRMEHATAAMQALSFGLPALDAHLPRGGLACGALHEVVPLTSGDLPATLGFIAALLAHMPRAGPAMLIASPQGLADAGQPHGHGLGGLGLDPAGLILVETQDERQTLWAMEEALRSGAPAAVVGAIGRELTLKASRRLHLAAGNSGLALIVLLPVGVAGSSAAATRWRIGAARAARDRFGLLSRWCWRTSLERCRNGRPGEWLLEWDHVAYRFSLAAPLAGAALSRGASEDLKAAGAGRP